MRRNTSWTILGALLALVGLNAFAGGYYVMASGSLVPGLLLFVVGAGAALAAGAVFARHGRGTALAKAVGWILIAWLIEQIAIVGVVSWLHPVTAIFAVALLVVARETDRMRAHLRSIWGRSR